MYRNLRLLLRLLALPAALFAAACGHRGDEVSAQGVSPGPPSVTTTQVRHWPDTSGFGGDIDSLYREADRTLLWFAGAHVSPAGRAALATLRAAPDDGLHAADYVSAVLDTLAASQVSVPFGAGDRTRFDYLLSGALLAFLEDLRFGRPAGAPPRVIAERDSARPALFEAITAAADRESVSMLAAAMRPPVREYADLRTALARYRLLAADHTVPTVRTPARLPVRPGDALPGAGALRDRLAALGDLSSGAAPDTTSVYDAALAAAVQRFQDRHGLAADGVLGRETLAALETPLSRRVTQLELALERVRRRPPPGSERLIVVNIPAFRLFAWDSATEQGVPAVASKVIVGRARRTPTPSIVEELRYLDFWPYWNVPKSILVNEIVPHLRKNPLYLRTQNMEVVASGDRPAGDSVGTDLLRQLARGSLRVRQRPGPGSALGRVKFVIPNDSSIYLHDTPDKSLFARARRDFSHGCIRVEKPRELAAWVLRDRPAWDADSLDRALAGPAFRRVMLERPIRVIVEYSTAVVTADGTVHFVPDIYGRDAPLAAALQGR